jgi:hypothetical protein
MCRQLAMYRYLRAHTQSLPLCLLEQGLNKTKKKKKSCQTREGSKLDWV